MKKNKNYFYDDRLNNNEIIEIKDNYRNMINSNLPNILIYAKQWLYIYISFHYEIHFAEILLYYPNNIWNFNIYYINNLINIIKKIYIF